MRFDFSDGELARDIEDLRCGGHRYNLTGHKMVLDDLRFNQLFTAMVSYRLDDWAERLLFHQGQYKRAVDNVSKVVRMSQRGADLCDIFHEVRDLSAQGKGLENQEMQYQEMQRFMGPMGRSYQGVCLDLIKAQLPTCLHRVDEGLSHLRSERSNVYYSVVGAIKDRLPTLGASFEQDRPKDESDPRLPIWRVLSPHRV